MVSVLGQCKQPRGDVKHQGTGSHLAISRGGLEQRQVWVSLRDLGLTLRPLGDGRAY